MNPELTELVLGVARLSVPLLCITMAAYAYTRVGILNIALDGEIVLASSLYVAGCEWHSTACGLFLSLVAALTIGLTVTISKSRLHVSDLLISLGLLYCCYGASSIVCFLVAGQPGNADLAASSLGETAAYILSLSIAATAILAFYHIRPLRLSKVIGESPQLARLDGVHLSWWLHVNGIIGAVLVSVTAVLLTEQGGGYTSHVSGERGFLALAIVAIARNNPLICCAWVLFFAAGQKLAFTMSGRIEILEGLTYLLAIILLGVGKPVSNCVNYLFKRRILKG